MKKRKITLTVVSICLPVAQKVSLISLTSMKEKLSVLNKKVNGKIYWDSNIIHKLVRDLGASDWRNLSVFHPFQKYTKGTLHGYKYPSVNLLQVWGIPQRDYYEYSLKTKVKYTHSHLLKWFHTGHIKQERQRSTETPCKRNKLQLLDIYSIFNIIVNHKLFWYFFLRKWVKWFCQAIKFNSAQSNVILSGKLDLCLRDLGDPKNIFQITSMKNDPYNCTACHIEYSPHLTGHLP